MTVVANFPIHTQNQDGTIIVGHAILWEIKDGLQATIDKGPVVFHSIWPNLLTLSNGDVWLPHVKFVKFMVRNCKNTHGAQLDISRLIGITRGMYQLPLSRVADEFCRAQNEALTRELKWFDTMSRMNHRDRVTVKILSPPNRPRFPNSLVVSITPSGLKEVLVVEIGTKLRLDTDSPLVGRFKRQDPDHVEAWTVTIVSFRGKTPLAIINNHILPGQKNHVIGQTVQDVEITVIPTEDLRDRMQRAIADMEAAFRYELGEMTPAEAQTYPRARLQVPMSPLLLMHPDTRLMSTDERPFSLLGGLTSFAAILHQPRWQLDASDVRFLEAIYRGKGGIAGLYGPPGSGKTALLAKAVAFARRHFNMSGKIVMTAYSSHEIEVIIQHIVNELPRFGLDPSTEVLLLETAGSTMRRVNASLGGRRDMNQMVNAFTMNSKVHFIAKSQPELWRNFRDLCTELSYQNRLPGPRWIEYNKELAKLQDEVRRRCSIVICTASTCGSGLLTGDRSSFNCSMLVFDGVSQCPMPAFLEAWQVMNPFRLVVAGDPNQMVPAAKSQEAKLIWERSPITFAEKLGPRVTPMLDRQFRMPKNLYHATNYAYYRGRIRTHQSTINRPEDLEILSKISKIEIDFDGNSGFRSLGRNFLILDITGSKDSYYPPESKLNVGDSKVTERLIRAMLHAGIHGEEIMNIYCFEGGFQQGLVMREHLYASGMAMRNVESSQGDERRVVILNTVHSVPGSGSAAMGLLAQPSCQNVSTSRQQSAFIFIGNLTAIRYSPTWLKWLRHANEANNPSGCYHRITQNAKFRVAGKEFSSTHTPGLYGQFYQSRFGS